MLGDDRILSFSHDFLVAPRTRTYPSLSLPPRRVERLKEIMEKLCFRRGISKERIGGGKKDETVSESRWIEGKGEKGEEGSAVRRSRPNPALLPHHANCTSNGISGRGAAIVFFTHDAFRERHDREPSVRGTMTP